MNKILKVIVGSPNGLVEIYDLNKTLVKTIQTNLNGNIIRIKPLNTDLFAFVSDNGTFQIWNTLDWTCLMEFNNVVRIYDIEYIENDSFAISDLRSIKFISMNTKEALKHFTLNSQVFCLRLISNGRLASGDNENYVKIWNLKNSTTHFVTLIGHESFILDIELICKNLIASASNDATVIIWDVNVYKRVITYTGHSSGVSVLRYMPKNFLMASGSLDGSIRIWNLTHGDHRYKLVHGDNTTGSILWSLDFLFKEQILVSGSRDGTVKFWNFQSPKPYMMQMFKTNHGLSSLYFLKQKKSYGSTCPLIKANLRRDLISQNNLNPTLIVVCGLLVAFLSFSFCYYKLKTKTNQLSSIENKVNMKVDVEGATTSLIISNKVVSNNFSLSNSLNITIDFKKLRKESCIGKGSFGNVFMCTHPSFKERKFAVKHIFPNDKQPTSLINEVNVLKELNHQNIVKYYDALIQPDGVYIFLEYISKGSLWDKIQERGKLDEQLVKEYTKQILEGIDYLHSHNVIHSDLKARNILIDDGDILKLADFGLSKKLPSDFVTSRVFGTCSGTCTHLAPEIIKAKNGKYGRKIDIWSLGVTMVEMLTGTHPWPQLEQDMQFFFKLINLKENEMPLFELETNATQNLKEFLCLTFKINYVERPSASALLKHEFICSVFKKDKLDFI